VNAICLVIDRLHCGYLGCYGNGWVGTPGIDALACESFVLDGAYLDAPSLDSLYRSYWLGQHALAHSGPAAVGRIGNPSYAEQPGCTPAARIVDPSHGLPRRLAAAGVATTLLTDDAAVARHPLAVPFDQIAELPSEAPARAAVEPEDTQAARFFAAALDAARAARPPFLVWAHSQGMAGCWDAPRELREQYVAPEDPSPPDFVQPPAIVLPADPDPDELLGIRQAYAAQVSVFDSCLEALLETLRDSPFLGETLFVLLSARGYPLGMHGHVGSPPAEAERLYGELTSIPWLLRLPNGVGAADRSSALVQPADLCATLADWFQCGPLAPRADGGLTSPPGRKLAEQVGHMVMSQSLLPLARGEAMALRDRAAIVSPSGERALRTPAWYARFSGPDAAALYVKPDDRWEINDVASRCPEVTDAMRQALEDFQATCTAANAGSASTPRELDDVLVHGLQ
jgi:hypothetical protein